jgi:hypothetical protein
MTMYIRVRIDDVDAARLAFGTQVLGYSMARRQTQHRPRSPG